MVAKIVLDDPDLFGNDAAEDEDETVFNSYAIERPELLDFVNPKRRVCVARAYKGEGKSALLRLAAARVQSKAKNHPIVIICSANNLAPNADSTDFSQWLRAWKASIFRQLASEIGTTIGRAWSDDTMGLVEEAERNGFRSRNIVSAILDRLNIGSISAGDVELSAISRTRLGTDNPEKVLERWAAKGTAVWLFIDDVDLNFQNAEIQKIKVASFFVACREIVNTVRGLSLRAAVRPNVWTVVKMEFEALSHVEQYTYDLSWSEEYVRRLLARRVEAYLRRRDLWDKVAPQLTDIEWEREKELIALVFDSPMVWGETSRPPHVLIYTLSKHRPRWAVELSKEAAASAVDHGGDKISRNDIFENLAQFGRRRIEDTVAEFRSQCPEIDELIGAFSREQEQYTTDELVKLIERKILSHLTPTIAGLVGVPKARDVAAFLFEIGIVFGRRELPAGGYEHVAFSDAPTLLRSRSDLDRGLAWEVHPVFRQALEIRDASGREFAPPRRRAYRRNR